MRRTGHMLHLFRESGSYESSDPLVCFLYLIMRDDLPTGKVAHLVEQVFAEIKADPTFTNGHLAKYAEHLARRLRGDRA